MVSVQVFRALVEVAKQAGVRAPALPPALQAEVGLAGSSELLLPRAETYRACELVLDSIHDPAIGLRSAELFSDTAFNPISLLVAHAATLHDALHALLRFHPLVSREARLQMIQSGDEVVLRCLPPTAASPRVRRFAAELAAASLFRTIRWFAPRARLIRASFQHHPPGYDREYARAFGGAARFAEPFTGLVFDRTLLNAAPRYPDAEVHEALWRLAEKRILRVQQGELLT